MLFHLLSFYLKFTFGWAFVVLFAKGRFMRSLSHLADPEVQKNSQFPSFTRDDFPRWNRRNLLLSAIFILPLRFLCTLFIFALCSFIVRIIHFYYKVPLSSEEKPIHLQEMNLKVVKLFDKIGLAIVGLIEKGPPIKCPLDPKRFPKLKFVKRPEEAPIIISNHVSVFDMFYFVKNNTPPGYVFKSGLIDAPLMNPYIYGLNCLPVYRMESSVKYKTLELIEKRLSDFRKGKIINPLMIFPEGTTTNGKTVIDFRKGAFEFLTPIRVCCVKYKGSNVDANYMMMSGFQNILLLLLNLYTEVQCYELEWAVEPAEGLTMEEYAAETKRIYVEAFGLADSKNTFKDRVKYEGEKCRFGKTDYE